MTGVGFLVGGVVTALFSPPTAFAVSGIGVVLLVIVGAALVARRSPNLRPAARAR